MLKLFGSEKYLYLQNFEAAVQDNVLVNGQPWQEAPDVEGDFTKSTSNYVKCVFTA